MKKMIYAMLAVILFVVSGCGSDEPSTSVRHLEFTILPFKGVEMSVGKAFPVFYGANVDRGMVATLHITGFNSYQAGSWYKATVESKNGVLTFLNAETIKEPKGIEYESLQLTVTPIDDYACDAVDQAGNKYTKINIVGLEMLSKGTYVVRANKVTVTPSGKSPTVYFLLTGVVSKP